MRLIRYYEDKKHAAWHVGLRRVLFEAEEHARQVESDHVSVIDLFHGMCRIFGDQPYEESFMQGISVQKLGELPLTRIQIVSVGRLPFSPQARRVVDSVEAIAKSWGHYTPTVRHLAFALFGSDMGEVILDGIGIRASERRELVRVTTPCPTDVFHPWVVDAMQWRMETCQRS